MRFGAQFARVVMAVSVSTVMTSTVVAPMAFQAHTARSLQSNAELVRPPIGPGSSVLGTSQDRTDLSDAVASPSTSAPANGPRTSTPVGEDANGLYYAPVSTDGPPEPALGLAGAQIDEAFYVIVSLPEVVGVTFFLDGGRVALSSLPPWNLYLGARIEPSKLDAGRHSVRAEVVYASGLTDTRTAAFTTLRG